MGDFPLEIVLALIGIAVPIGAFLWEFVLAGRRRLGYRVQMDTPVTGEIESVFPGVLPQLRPSADGASPDLKDISVVLVRVENSGITTIDSHDYKAPDAARIGLHLRFPQRRVIGMAVNELSDPALADNLDADSGIAVREDTGGHIGVIDLPKVPLAPGDHYKILAILQRSEGMGEYPQPVLRGGIKGGRITETRSRTGVPLMMVALTVFLVLVIIVQLVVAALEPSPTPLDCASGKLTVLGSTAFAQVIKDAAEQYRKSCAGASFAYGFEGSERGLDRLAEQGTGDSGLIAITDGAKGGGYPALVHRPLALSLFTMIAHPGVGVRDLTLAQIRDLYRGKVGNWREVGGPDLPVVLVNRIPGSGTRTIFERRLLEGAQPERPHVSCTALKGTVTTAPAQCEVQVTADMRKAVAEIPGAVGYSEFAEAVAAGLPTIAIDGVGASRDAAVRRAYPFWGVEYAYSNGELPGGSLAASFLHFLTDRTGKEVLRAHGNAPCADLPDPGRCLPDQ
ncbi:substrate-binding domain-containing protein [Nocardia implantans]|uniref:Substrate-binding domain-containing protein n=1 Tax=Nocardia implantans TaxID=3108168 RepID=A0ABU6ATK7_9NOCA|nr:MULTISPECIES: substrate-binding domain-containing protein [unclassified Nocardia]MBF6191090.1 substrate-binding domain-containing protein [Nocardia beijingensis]MEA3529089.1 substrate-binding domain-containing protein [Nocardia sp. CDC192]MEB3510754.1 substrate-binding domain-containing protein [Nocardia sp. CDC186]